VVTSTYAERILRDLSGYTRNRRLSLTSLAAKHVTQNFHGGVSRARRQADVREPTQRERPGWTKYFAEGGRLTGLHVFQKEWGAENPRVFGRVFLEATRAAWRALTPQDKQRYAKKAEAKRTVANVVIQSPLEQALTPQSPELFGPWSLGTRDGMWPLAHHIVADVTQGKGQFEQARKAWLQDG